MGGIDSREASSLVVDRDVYRQWTVDDVMSAWARARALRPELAPPHHIVGGGPGAAQEAKTERYDGEMHSIMLTRVEFRDVFTDVTALRPGFAKDGGLGFLALPLDHFDAVRSFGSDRVNLMDVLVAMCLCCKADRAADRAHLAFRIFDFNLSNNIELREMQSFLRVCLRVMRRNGVEVDPAVVAMVVERVAERAFADADTDADGRLTSTEFIAWIERVVLSTALRELFAKVLRELHEEKTAAAVAAATMAAMAAAQKAAEESGKQDTGIVTGSSLGELAGAPTAFRVLPIAGLTTVGSFSTLGFGSASTGTRTFVVGPSGAASPSPAPKAATSVPTPPSGSSYVSSPSTAMGTSPAASPATSPAARTPTSNSSPASGTQRSRPRKARSVRLGGSGMGSVVAGAPDASDAAVQASIRAARKRFTVATRSLQRGVARSPSFGDLEDALSALCAADSVAEDDDAEAAMGAARRESRSKGASSRHGSADRAAPSGLEVFAEMTTNVAGGVSFAQTAHSLMTIRQVQRQYLKSHSKRRAAQRMRAVNAKQARQLYNPQELQQLRDLFMSFCSRREPRMTAARLREFLCTAYHRLEALPDKGATVANAMFRVMDAYHNGVATFSEMVKVLGVLTRGSIEDKADVLFEIMDRDGDASIRTHSILPFLQAGGKSRYMEHSRLVTRLFRLVDVNSDGYLSRSELRTALVCHPTLYDCFVSMILPGIEEAEIEAFRDNRRRMSRFDMDVLRVMFDMCEEAQDDRCAELAKAHVQAARVRRRSIGGTVYDTENETAAAAAAAAAALEADSGDGSGGDSRTAAGAGAADADDDRPRRPTSAPRQQSVVAEAGMPIASFRKFMVENLKVPRCMLPVINRVFAVLDEDRSNYLSWREVFYGIEKMAGTSGVVNHDERAEFYFNVYDLDDSGFIDGSEIMSLLYATNVGSDVDMEMIACVMEKWDKDGDGRITLAEFTDATRADPELLEVFGRLFAVDSPASAASAGTLGHTTVASLVAARAGANRLKNQSKADRALQVTSGAAKAARQVLDATVEGTKGAESHQDSPVSQDFEASGAPIHVKMRRASVAARQNAEDQSGGGGTRKLQAAKRHNYAARDAAATVTDVEIAKVTAQNLQKRLSLVSDVRHKTGVIVDHSTGKVARKRRASSVTTAAGAAAAGFASAGDDSDSASSSSSARRASRRRSVDDVRHRRRTSTLATAGQGNDAGAAAAATALFSSGRDRTDSAATGASSGFSPSPRRRRGSTFGSAGSGDEDLTSTLTPSLAGSLMAGDVNDQGQAMSEIEQAISGKSGTGRGESGGGGGGGGGQTRATAGGSAEADVVLESLVNERALVAATGAAALQHAQLVKASLETRKRAVDAEARVSDLRVKKLNAAATVDDARAHERERRRSLAAEDPVDGRNDPEWRLKMALDLSADFSLVSEVELPAVDDAAEAAALLARHKDRIDVAAAAVYGDSDDEAEHPETSSARADSPPAASRTSQLRTAHAGAARAAVSPITTAAHGITAVDFDALLMPPPTATGAAQTGFSFSPAGSGAYKSISAPARHAVKVGASTAPSGPLPGLLPSLEVTRDKPATKLVKRGFGDGGGFGFGGARPAETEATPDTASQLQSRPALQRAQATRPTPAAKQLPAQPSRHSQWGTPTTPTPGSSTVAMLEANRRPRTSGGGHRRSLSANEAARASTSSPGGWRDRVSSGGGGTSHSRGSTHSGSVNSWGDARAGGDGGRTRFIGATAPPREKEPRQPLSRRTDAGGEARRSSTATKGGAARPTTSHGTAGGTHTHKHMGALAPVMTRPMTTATGRRPLTKGGAFGDSFRGDGHGHSLNLNNTHHRTAQHGAGHADLHMGMRLHHGGEHPRRGPGRGVGFAGRGIQSGGGGGFVANPALQMLKHTRPHTAAGDAAARGMRRSGW